MVVFDDLAVVVVGNFLVVAVEIGNIVGFKCWVVAVVVFAIYFVSTLTSSSRTATWSYPANFRAIEPSIFQIAQALQCLHRTRPNLINMDRPDIQIINDVIAADI